LVNRDRVYRLLVAGFSAVQIAKRMKISKGYISRLIREFEKGGYIQCINPNEKPRFYIATKKKLTPIKFTTAIPDKHKRLSHRLDMVEVQKCSFICDVLVPPTRAKWDTEYEWRQGVTVQQYSHYPFKDFGLIKFRRFKSSNVDRLMVILPRICVHKNEVDAVEDILLNHACNAYAWIKKKFNMGIGRPRVCQKPHFAVVAREPELIKAIDKGSFNVNGVMADKSPPSFVHEVESEDYHDVVNYLDSIRKIKFLEEKILYNQKCIRELIDKMEIIVGNQEGIASILKSLSVKKPLLNNDDSYMDVT
jgi:hypothetical protein